MRNDELQRIPEHDSFGIQVGSCVVICKHTKKRNYINQFAVWAYTSYIYKSN